MLANHPFSQRGLNPRDENGQEGCSVCGRPRSAHPDGPVRSYKPPEPLRRSVVAVEFLDPEQDGQVRALITCDCGTATDLTVVIGGQVPGSAELAYTCGGCQTPHWFELRAAG